MWQCCALLILQPYIHLTLDCNIFAIFQALPAIPPICLQMILLLVTFILVAQAQQTCYSINGNPDTTMSPCNASATNSGCCYANEYCLTNGLCINQALVGGNRLSRVGCTDKTWEDPACFQECKTGASILKS